MSTKLGLHHLVYQDEVKKRAERHKARVKYVGRYYDTASITLPTPSKGRDRYDDYTPQLVSNPIALTHPIIQINEFIPGLHLVHPGAQMSSYMDPTRR
jgi:hypothetical protein